MLATIGLMVLPITKIQSLEIPLVSGWELADGSVILNEYQLWEAGIECDMLFCFFPMGTSSSCDNGRLVAASGDWFWRHQDEPGVKPVAYDVLNDLLIR
jgi:hypothetical protein